MRATGIVKNLLFFPISLGAMLEFQYIEGGLLVFSANWILPCDESIKKLIFRIKPVYMYSYSEIALIHDTAMFERALGLMG